MTSKPSLYDTVTQSIIAAIEANPGKPAMPWHRDATAPLFMPENALTKKSYQGINTVVLWVSAEQQGFKSPIWATYRQFAELGCQVRKGEKSTPVVFYKSFEVIADPESSENDGQRRVARTSAVFNCAQVDGYPEPVAVPDLGPVERSSRFDAFVSATGAVIAHGGDRAFYQPSTDTIRMPDETRFCGTATMARDESYMAVLAHELAHWSGAKHRLNRDFGSRFGDAAYAAEEIVAELECRVYLSRARDCLHTARRSRPVHCSVPQASQIRQPRHLYRCRQSQPGGGVFDGVFGRPGGRRLTCTCAWLPARRGFAF